MNVRHQNSWIHRMVYQVFAWLLFLPVLARAGGDEVAIVYNTEMPGSKMVAYHYAAMRHVPTGQIFGFALSTNELVSRDDFTDLLQKPLADQLEATGLWRFGSVNFPATKGNPAHIETRVVASKIRYLALCYGVPLKIAPSSLLERITIKIENEKLRVNEAAVDSELTWLPLSRNEVQLAGPMPNPFYGATNRASLNCTNGILLVTRLDGPTADIANQLVDKSMEAENHGLWGRAYFDARGLQKTNDYYLGDQWLLVGAEVCRQIGFDVETDTNEETFPATFPMSHIAIYGGWYSGNTTGPFLASKMEFMPGAFACHIYSYNASTLRDPLHTWCGALLAKGATCTVGSVYEPYLQLTPNLAGFLFAWANGATFGEAAWMSERALSWQSTMVGDPLYQPFGRDLLELHAQLAREKSPLIEWSFARMSNRDRIRGAGLSQLTSFLEAVPATKKSAVLTEKLAGIYEAQGKPSSAIDAWQKALKLNPSPQQRIRIRLTLAEKLVAAGRKADAIENWRQLLAEAPDYPGAPAIRDSMKLLASQK